MSLPGFLTLHAGPHPRQDCPVRFTLPEPLPAGEWELIASDVDRPLPLQRLGGNEIAFVEPNILADQHRRYYIRPQSKNSECSVRIEEGRHALSVTVNGLLLTRYIYGDVPARPYFFPLLLPPAIGLTRVYPMQENIPGETQDHPHHRSLWIAFGDVNGVDNWSEEAGHGFTLHQSLNQVESGEVFGRFATTSLWTDADRSPLLTQDLEVTVWALNCTTRLIDFTIWLTATHGNVTFGDTKEGGILAARVASALDVPRGGRIENSYGGIDEAETWGKAAHWCDYSGKIEEQPVGLAIMDHPLSFRY